MNNGRPAVAFLSACCLLLVILGISKAQTEDGVFDLAVTAIESQPFAAGIGDETTYYVTYENMHTSPVPASTALELLLTISDAQNEEIVAQCRQEAEIAGMMNMDQARRVLMENCTVVLRSPQTHLVRAEFVEPGLRPANGAFAAIPGDLNPSNNGRISTVVPAADEAESELPTELTRIFAGLAIFFAVMALVAAGTEVTIDSLKVAVGLKSKVTSMDALERMEKYMPGQLGALSVSTTTREEFRRLIREMRGTLTATLQAVESAVALREQIGQGEFGSTFRRADQLGQEYAHLKGKELYSFKKQLQAYVNKVLGTLEKRLGLSGEALGSLREQMAQEISVYDGQDPQLFLDEFVSDLQDPHFWSTQLVDGWLAEEQETFYRRSSSPVMESFDREVKPILLGVGFSSASINALRLELVSRLGIIEAGISHTTDTFLTSMRNVLDAVELRRYDTQSPSRKLWRKLRAWRGGIFPPDRFRSALLPASLFASLFFYLAWIRHLTDESLFPGSLPHGFSQSSSYPLFSWLCGSLFAAAALLLLLHYARRATGATGGPWFIGLNGALALSLLVGLALTLLLWVLQPFSANRVSGSLQLLEWQQPWWSWLASFALLLFALLLVSSFAAKGVYDRLVRRAVRDGRLAADINALGDATILLRTETGWNLLRQGFDVTRVDPERFVKADTIADYESGILNTPHRDFVFSPETMAQFVMQRSDQQRDEETSRLRILRVASIAVGLVLAYALQIDVLALLGEAFPDIPAQLNWTLISGETLHAWRNWLPADKAITVGIVLTAFAASAGSAFWHDRLDQLQASKKGAQAAAQLLNQASQINDSTKT